MSALKGKSIVITRPRGQADEIASLLRQAGAECVLFPTIEIIPPPSWEACDAAIDRLKEYDGIVVTSSNGAEGFFGHVGKSRREVKLDLPVFVVGVKTKDAVASFGICPEEPPAVHDGKHLADLIVARGARGKRYLLPKGNLGRSAVRGALEAAGARCDEVIVYHTVTADLREAEQMRRKFTAGQIDAVTFFSPSSVENFSSVIPAEVMKHVAVAVIGRPTGTAAAECGMTVHVTAEPSTAAGMVRTLEQYFEQQMRSGE